MVDANPLQRLTGAHLEKAADLSEWSVQEVAPDRYLVEARDLEPWLAGGSAG